MPDSDLTLLDKARSVSLNDADLASCWQHVVRGIEVGWLDEDEIRELVHDLRNRIDYGVQELFFERRGDRMHVRLLRDDRTCDADQLIRFLDSLAPQ
jgi:hypothetical protein